MAHTISAGKSELAVSPARLVAGKAQLRRCSREKTPAWKTST